MPTSPRRTEYLLDRYGGQTEEGLAVERCQQSTKPGLSSKSRRVPQHAYVKLTSKEIHGTGNSQNTPIWSPQQPLLLQRHCHSLLTDRGISSNIFSFRSSPSYFSSSITCERTTLHRYISLASGRSQEKASSVGITVRLHSWDSFGYIRRFLL